MNLPGMRVQVLHLEPTNRHVSMVVDLKGRLLHAMTSRGDWTLRGESVEANNQISQAEPQAGKRGTLRAYALIISLEVAFIAILWAAHVPWGILNIVLVLAAVIALIGKRLMGSSKYVQIVSPEFVQRIDNRFCSESKQLSSLGFQPLFFVGETFSLFRILLIFPALVFLTMLLNREVASIQNGSELCFGFPVFISSSRTTYAHPLQLGIKYYTRFQDGTILLTKNFGGKAKYGPRVVFQKTKNASISDTWAEHQKQIEALQATGKQVDREVSFQAYSEISAEA